MFLNFQTKIWKWKQFQTLNLYECGVEWIFQSWKRIKQKSWDGLIVRWPKYNKYTPDGNWNPIDNYCNILNQYLRYVCNVNECDYFFDVYWFSRKRQQPAHRSLFWIIRYIFVFIVIEKDVQNSKFTEKYPYSFLNNCYYKA